VFQQSIGKMVRFPDGNWSRALPHPHPFAITSHGIPARPRGSRPRQNAPFQRRGTLAPEPGGPTDVPRGNIELCIASARGPATIAMTVPPRTRASQWVL
jgi:hypothetical protein